MKMNSFEIIKNKKDIYALQNENGEILFLNYIIKQTPNKLFLFKGEMGSGKTTLIRQICEELGCSSVINSPTFALINEYASTYGKIYHIDCYRLKNIDEAINSGITDCIYSHDLCFIEWPEIIIPLVDKNATLINITVLENEKRMLQIYNCIYTNGSITLE